MLIRSRSARFAALALAVTAPLVAAGAGPVFALGETTTAQLTSPADGTSSTFTWSYEFDQNDGNGLSNIAIGFCSNDILKDVLSADAGGADVAYFYDGDVQGQHEGFGPGIKFNLPEDSGTITVTFKSPHPISENSFRIESHSGRGGGDGVTTADGPGPCASDPIIDDDEDPIIDDEDPIIDDEDPIINEIVIEDPGPGTDTHGPAVSTPADPGPGTTVLGVILSEPTSNPAGTTNNGVLSTTDTLPQAAAELPHTGAGNIQFLTALALSLLAAGVALRATFGRRIRSASSPS